MHVRKCVMGATSMLSNGMEHSEEEINCAILTIYTDTIIMGLPIMIVYFEELKSY